MHFPVRRYAAIAAAAFTLFFAGASPSTASTTAVTAKTCSSSYVHAIIGGAQRCLRRGEFCAHGYARQYRRYGFSCTVTDEPSLRLCSGAR